MNKTKKILAIAVLLMLIMGSLTWVKAGGYSKENIFSGVTISNGVKEGNKITFDINLPSQVGLRGDVDDDGKVDMNDSTLLVNYCAMLIGIDQINAINADVNADRDIHVADVVALNMALLGPGSISSEQLEEAKELGYYPETEMVDMDKIAINTPIVLNGTLASKSSVTLKRDDNGKYKAEVTIPEGTNEGTIGVTLVQGVFINNKANFNGFVNSNLFSIKGNNTITLPENKVTISDGVQNDNKVTFKVNLEKGTELTGDVNSDGKVDATDVDLLSKYIKHEITEGISAISSDVTGDGRLDTFDVVALRRIVQNNNNISLDGTLKDKVSSNLLKDAEGNFYIEVTVPNDVTEGTIKVSLAEGVFINASNVKNKSVSSELFSYSKTGGNKTEDFKVIEQKDEKQDDGKIKVTVIVNKELDKDKLPNGWTLSEDGKSITKIMNKGEKEEIELVAKDGSKIKYTVVAGATLNDSDEKKDTTVAPTKHPNTGTKNTLLIVIVGIAIFGIIAFSKYIKNREIK